MESYRDFIISWSPLVTGGIFTIAGWLYRSLKQENKDLEAALKEVAESHQKLSLTVAGTCVNRDEYLKSMDTIHAKIEKLGDNINHKLDQIIQQGNR